MGEVSIIARFIHILLKGGWGKGDGGHGEKEDHLVALAMCAVCEPANNKLINYMGALLSGLLNSGNLSTNIVSQTINWQLLPGFHGSENVRL